MGKIMLKIFMGRETVRLHRLLFNQVANVGSLPNTARIEALKLADSYAAIDDGLLDGEVIGNPTNIAGVEVLKNPLEWDDKTAYIKIFWNTTIYDAKSKEVLYKQSFSVLWDLYKRFGSVGIVLPDGLIQWAYQALPGDELILGDNRTGKIFEIVVTGQNPLKG